jgi:GrpB-like predicted nucleotidyltransferase (UPF0157 family)
MLIQEYSENWIINFKAISKTLLDTLPIGNIIVEHVGSTAVPGLAAKPIIDIDLVYKHPVQFEEIKNRLDSIGYFHNGNQGIADREVFKRKDIIPPHPVLDHVDHHLYVCEEGSAELQNHILFRDFLKRDDAARKQYQELKFKIAEEAKQNRKQYAALKEDSARHFIYSILQRAKIQRH